DRDLAADDDEGDQRMHPAEVDEHEQRRADEQLVGDRVEEGTERRRHAEPAREIAVGPVGERDDDEERGADDVLRLGRKRGVVHADDEGDRKDPRPGEERRQVEEHRRIVPKRALFGRRRPRPGDVAQRSSVLGLNLRASSKRKVSANFHGRGSRLTSPNGAARRTASTAILIVSLAWRGSRSTSMRRMLPSPWSSISSTGIASNGSGTAPR